MKLRALIKNLSGLIVKGSKEIDITGITENSRTVSPGNLFIAKKGKSQDGSLFIHEAVKAGAHAVLTDLFDPFLSGVTQLIHPEIQAIETQLAKAFYHDADQKLFLVGITGTNGKTTTSYLIKYLLDHLGAPCGLIGTIEWIVGDHVLPSTHTTPGVLTNYKLFSDMSLTSKACVMEVSSHALDQNRVQGIEFDVAIFTNLTQDHLDYHLSMDAYGSAKAKLFTSLLPEKKAHKKFAKKAVINLDDPFAFSITKECPVPILTYGLCKGAMLRAEKIELFPNGMQWILTYQGESHEVSSSLIGRFNVYNLLAAIGACLAYGVPLSQILPLIPHFKKVPGRLEKVPNSKELNIFVDYAHTDDALANVLSVLREITQGKIITVFGCGGNRDFLKRPKMGHIAEKLSDQTIITNDNPRGEDPEEIARQILLGFSYPEKASVILDRRAAIQEAISRATRDDAILIAGKGHETYQIFGVQKTHFDDREEVAALTRI